MGAREQTPSGARVEPLGQEECFTLLRTVGMGRVAWSAPDGHAVVLPVNFVLDDGAVVFKSSSGHTLDAVLQGHSLSFEVDDVEPALHVGWSVLVTGPAEVVTDAEEVRRLAELPLAPWVSLPSPVFVRLSVAEVTGRRLPLHPGGVTVERVEGEEFPGE